MAVLLDKPKPDARSLVIAPRMPAASKLHTGNPFTSEGDVVLDCEGGEDGRACGWHWMGPRALAKAAYEAHRRLYHSESIGVVLLNQARQ